MSDSRSSSCYHSGIAELQYCDFAVRVEGPSTGRALRHCVECSEIARERQRRVVSACRPRTSSVGQAEATRRPKQVAELDALSLIQGCRNSRRTSGRTRGRIWEQARPARCRKLARDGSAAVQCPSDVNISVGSPFRSVFKQKTEQCVRIFTAVEATPA